MRKVSYISNVFVLLAAMLLLAGSGAFAQNPDSLKKNLPVADTLKAVIADTLAVAADSLVAASDSLAAAQDSAAIVILTPKEIKRLQRDSVRAYRDSVIRNTPRILLTYVFDDSTRNQRMFLWNADTYFNKPVSIDPDTTFNDWFIETPDRKNDVGAASLGVSGSAMQYNNWFLRPQQQIFPFFDVYLPYSYTPETLPFYNTKTPYTELGYWGTLFANKKMEETNIRFLHTQNFTPSFNINFLYQRFGAAGMLEHEKTDNRTLALTGNYLGKRYMAQGGYIFNRIKRDENGGISDPTMVLDTLLDAKVIPITLKNANNTLKRNTLFLTHSYGIPFKFLQKKGGMLPDSLALAADSLAAGRDAGKMVATAGLKPDSLIFGEGTMAYIGHSIDASFYSKKYTDAIGLDDSLGRALYHNKFYINPTESADSMRVFKLENRFFINMQPWAKEALVSNVSAGIGHQYLSLYGFKQDYFLEGNSNTTQNNMYMYFGAGGKLKKYFSWEGLGVYNFAGYYQNDFSVDGKVTFSSYPKTMKRGIHLTGKLHISQQRPNWFYNNAYTNHYVWENDFAKTTQTRIEAKLDIPDWKMEAFFGYAMLKNNTYFDSLSVVRQNPEAMSILTAYLRKDFKLWKFHMDNKILFQVSSDEDVVPLPELALDLRYYFQFELVKNVLTAQLGANATFTTEYYAPGYSPALGVFYNQKVEKIGETPYVDLFVNLQWKRASIFVKYVNAALGWPDNDYFSTFRYIRSQKALKFGIHWPFYVK
ncbi:MAG: putative porin [Bacteroidales bacterium]|nr:putative porin [Bacteroidales bacterium]